MIDIVAALAHSPFIIFLVILTAITLAVLSLSFILMIDDRIELKYRLSSNALCSEHGWYPTATHTMLDLDESSIMRYVSP